MARTVEKTEAEQQALREAMEELRSTAAPITPARMFELLSHVPPADVRQSSAALIRELRGPLPGEK